MNMKSVFRIIHSHKKCIKLNNFLTFSTKTNFGQQARPALRAPVRKSSPALIGPYGWFMLTIPVSALGLGIWQVQRLDWKQRLIAEMEERMNSAPRPLPDNLADLENLEFYPVHVRGTFLHDKELYMGPRQLLEKEEQLKPTFFDTSSQGYLVITPFKLEGREETILVNRGWVEANRIKPINRYDAQVSGVVDVIGIVRKHENRPTFAIKNKEGSNLYFYRDLESMCAVTGASPVFLDQTKDYNNYNPIVGGQTRVNLRNEHMSYMITWFSLSGITAYMWIRQFVLKK